MATNGSVEKVKEKAIAVKPAMSIQSLIEQSANELGKALPSHMKPERIIRIALTTLRMNPKLYQCSPYSFLAALFQCAQLGLEPNIEGQAYIIPYHNRKTGQMVANFQVGYKGYIELFWRHESALSITAQRVCKNDSFHYDYGMNEISHIPVPFGQDRGGVMGYYALAHLKGGGRQFEVMSKDEAFLFGKRFSQCYSRKEGKFFEGTPWAEHFDEMAKKTVLKALLKKLPKSIEIQRALAMDETVKSRINADMVEVPNEMEYLQAPEEDGEEAKAVEAEAVEETKTVESAGITKEELFGKDN